MARMRYARGPEASPDNIEPELTLAVDSMFPNAVLMECLREFGAEFPNVPRELFTEGLGAAEQRLRDGLARLGIYSPLSTAPSNDLEWEPMTSIAWCRSWRANHPLARETPPLERHTLEKYVQLVLTDRTPLSQNLRGGICRCISGASPISARGWNFCCRVSAGATCRVIW